MISISLAKRLKKAGLLWSPAIHDFFAVPGRGMDKKVFVISDLLANIEQRFGHQMVAFQGASEWALDYLVTTEAVWLPTEAQIRHALQLHLVGEVENLLTLECRPGNCICKLRFLGQEMAFEAIEAVDAYGEALLFILQVQNEPDH